MKSLKTVAIILLLFLSSCEFLLTDIKMTPVDEDLTYTDKLLVQAVFITDDVLNIRLEPSWNPTGQVDLEIGDTRVRLYKVPGVICLDTVVYFGKDKERHLLNYKSISSPSHGDKLSLILNTDRYGETIAETIIPIPVPITDSAAVKQNPVNPFYRFTFEISDPSVYKNYFQVSSKYKVTTIDRLSGGLPTPQTDTTTSIYPHDTPLTDPVFKFMSDVRTSLKEPFDISTYYKPRIFPDDAFNGKKYGFTVDIPLIDPKYFNFDENRYKTTYIFELYSISYDMFEFLRTAYANAILDGDIYAQPIMVYTNIRNGSGFFGAMSHPTVASLRIKDNEYLKFP